MVRSPRADAPPAALLPTLTAAALWSRAAALRRAWDAGAFRHVVIDGLLDPDTVGALAAEEFGDLGSARWLLNRHLSQRMRSRTGLTSLGPTARALVDVLSAPDFTRWVEVVTGLDGLVADRELVDGGLAAMGRGDFLDLHHDLLAHPYRRRWRRRVNLLVYLEPGWEPGWGGELELWDADGARPLATIEPRAGRAVLFEVGVHALHGVPRPLTCPPGVSRKSLALYYFDDHAPGAGVRGALRYRRPGAGPLARALLAGNNVALALYHQARRTLGLRDETVSRWLRAAGHLLRARGPRR